jgi:hypothetical protein
MPIIAGSLSLLPIAECSRCGTLQKQYEKALLDEMQAMRTHGIAGRSGNVEGAEKAGKDIETAGGERLNAREALWLHVAMYHPEISSASSVG